MNNKCTQKKSRNVDETNVATPNEEGNTKQTVHIADVMITLRW